MSQFSCLEWREPGHPSGCDIALSDLGGPQNQLSRIATGMAHDMNNLLQILSGNLAMLAREIKDHPGAARRIEMMLSSVELGAALTHGVLDHYRAKPTAIDVETIDACRYATIMPLLSDAVGPEISVRLDISPALWPVRLNFNHFQNALLNLATNARDAIGGRGCLTVTARNSPATGTGIRDLVLVSIADNGLGIPEELMPKIFIPFFTTKARGSGIGLANVADFARSAAAGLSVESEPGRGTTFTFAFPASR